MPSYSSSEKKPLAAFGFLKISGTHAKIQFPKYKCILNHLVRCQLPLHKHLNCTYVLCIGTVQKFCF